MSGLRQPVEQLHGVSIRGELFVTVGSAVGAERLPRWVPLTDRQSGAPRGVAHRAACKEFMSRPGPPRRRSSSYGFTWGTQNLEPFEAPGGACPRADTFNWAISRPRGRRLAEHPTADPSKGPSEETLRANRASDRDEEFRRGSIRREAAPTGCPVARDMAARTCCGCSSDSTWSSSPPDGPTG